MNPRSGLVSGRTRVCSFCAHVFEGFCHTDTNAWWTQLHHVFPSGFVYLLWVAFILCNLLLAPSSFFSRNNLLGAEMQDGLFFFFFFFFFSGVSHISIEVSNALLGFNPGFLVSKITPKPADYCRLRHSQPFHIVHKPPPLKLFSYSSPLRRECDESKSRLLKSAAIFLSLEQRFAKPTWEKKIFKISLFLWSISKQIPSSVPKTSYRAIRGSPRLSVLAFRGVLLRSGKWYSLSRAASSRSVRSSLLMTCSRAPLVPRTPSNSQKSMWFK